MSEAQLDRRATEQFGPYEVYERLGMGGMAMVHRAKKRGPEGYEQTVALKRMLSHLAEDQTFVESFVREAKVASLLVHPNIAQVYDFGRNRGIYYIAMELVAGFDVRKILRTASRANEAIPLPVVLSILGELSDALDHAHNFIDDEGHRLDIVHRDISPSNLIVAQTGHLKVIDFGIAKASSRQLHTESGKVKGKLGYMSPEAALGLNSGPVSDMFSTGVVAWELITASPLFTTRTDMETMQRIREGTIAPPSYHNPACPPELDQLILSALEREPRQRLSSAASFRAGLDDIVQRHGVPTSARSVVEWIGRFALPSDNWPRLSERAKPPSYSPPVTGNDPTAQIRTGRRSESPQSRVTTPKPKLPLRRSAEHVALATEIWGEDQSSAPAPGPDFSIQDLKPPPALPIEGQNAVPTRLIGPSMTPPPAAPIIDPAMRVSGASTHGSVISLPHAQSARMSNLPLAPSPRHSTPPPGTYDSRSHAQPLSAPLPTSQPPAVYHSQPQVSHPQLSQPQLSQPQLSQPHLSQPHLSQPQLSPPRKGGLLPFLILGGLVVVAGVLIAILIGRGGDDTQLAALDKPADVVPTAEPITQEPKAQPETIEPTTEPTKPEPKPEPKLETTPTIADGPKPSEPDPIRKPTKPQPNRKPTQPPITTKPNKPETPEAPVITEDKPEKATQPTITEKPPEKPPEKPLIPDKPQPTKPARTPVVAASAVTKLSGEVPALRVNTGDADMIMAKVCIDDSGRVTSVSSKGSTEIVSELQRGLSSWRYKPFLRDGKPSAVCFPLTIKLIKR